MATTARPKPQHRRGPDSRRSVSSSSSTTKTTTGTKIGTNQKYPRHKPAQFPINKLKHRLRDLDRLLKGAKKLSEEKRSEYEREIAATRAELVHNAAQSHKANVAKKYHMVRFFDRKKADRVLKQARKALEACPQNDPAQLEQLQRRVSVCEVDLNYTLYSPVAVVYSSLYPKSSSDSTTETTTTTTTDQKQRGNPKVRALVEQAMKDGTLADLRETLHPDQLGLDSGVHKYLGPRGAGNPRSSTAAKSASSQRNNNSRADQSSEMVDVDDDADAADSDGNGGFFE